MVSLASEMDTVVDDNVEELGAPGYAAQAPPVILEAYGCNLAGRT